MNVYQWNVLLEPTTPPVIGDAPGLERFCRQVGYLIAAGGADCEWMVQAGINTGAWAPTNVVADNPKGNLQISTPFRLPQQLEPLFPSATVTGSPATTITAGAGISEVFALADDSCNNVLSNLDRPVVNKGCLIVAYLPAGVDVSDELSTQLNVPMCNGQRLVIGFANQDALDGIYTPFTSAWAYAAVGGDGLSPVAVVAVGNARPNRLTPAR